MTQQKATRIKEEDKKQLMSKYTKALEKAQQERENKITDPAAQAEGGNENGVDASFKEERVIKSAGHPSFDEWENRITTIKHANTDNRVVSLMFPESMISEQYRMLRTRLKAKMNNENAKVILISSSTHSEGKTLTAVNLAYSLAEDGKTRVALIDADLRRGKVADYLGFKVADGLSDLLSSDMSPQQVMVKNSRPNLFIIPRGRVSKVAGELVGSEKFHYLIQGLRNHFDYIIVDAPPILATADAGIMASEVDGVLFVIQIGRTPKSIVAHAHTLFKQTAVKMLGYVLTNVEFQTADYKYYGYEYYDDSGKMLKQPIKEKAMNHLRNTGKRFTSLEERFNNWWQRTFLK
ncbi:MAG TPA: CpsD/CapB family tyrosine-protein kinase [Candidatus Omnitrophota bacterium]|nr:CpsD/CapB family tyrosine-protein kinase [Candidatus Omnitrophota bacterium]